MRFVVEREALEEGYSLVQKALPSRAVLQILKTVRVEAIAPDIVRLRGSNRILDITVDVPADVKEAGACCVDPLAFDAAVMFEGSINFSLKKRLTVSCGKRRHSFAVIPVENYIKPRSVKGWTSASLELAKTIVEAFSMTELAVSGSADRPIYQSFLVDPHDNCIIAADGNQVATYEVPGLSGKLATPPAKYLSTILSYLERAGEEGKLEVSFGDWSGFRGAGWEVHLNSYAGEFTSVARSKTQELLNSEPTTCVLLDSEVLSSALSLCKLYSDRAYAGGHSYHIDVSLADSVLRLQMEVPDVAEVDEPVAVKEMTGEGFTGFRIHPSLALEALSVLEDDVELRFFGITNPFLILDPTNSNYCYLQVAMASSTARPKVAPTPSASEETDF